MAPSNSNRPRATNNLPAERYQGRASFPTEPPSKNKRKAILEDTLAQGSTFLKKLSITQKQTESTFFNTQLEPLDPGACPGHISTAIQVRYGDTCVVARQLIAARPDYQDRLAMLNCASDAELAGGCRNRFGTTQEDALCYSTTLFWTLEQWRENYPWRKAGVMQRNDRNSGQCSGIYSPKVVIFKDELANDCKALPPKDWKTVSVLSVAALACPPLTPVTTRDSKHRDSQEMVLKSSNDLKIIQERWRMILRMAAHHGHSVLVLAALGCGVWKCPSKQVAEILKTCLRETEFQG